MLRSQAKWRDLPRSSATNAPRLSQTRCRPPSALSSKSAAHLEASASRRACLVAGLLLAGLDAKAEEQAAVDVIADDPGFGLHVVRQGDLVLVHYVGSLEDGQVFDSTRGGFKYRDGGPGVFRPVVVRLSGSPVPGITLGLQQGIAGMTIGGKRSIKVPAQLGFGQQTVLAPYAIVPAGASLRYDIELLRVSSLGPDMLVKGISRCGAGGASATADNCANIEPAEFF